MTDAESRVDVTRALTVLGEEDVVMFQERNILEWKEKSEVRGDNFGDFGREVIGFHNWGAECRQCH
jgi:hypothetical protein